MIVEITFLLNRSSRNTFIEDCFDVFNGVSLISPVWNEMGKQVFELREVKIVYAIREQVDRVRLRRINACVIDRAIDRASKETVVIGLITYAFPLWARQLVGV